MENLVLKNGTFTYDLVDNQVLVPEDELKKAGYVKLADDEQVVKKVGLVKGWATFMEENKHLPFSCRGEGKCFTNAVLNDFFEIDASSREKQELFNLLSRAYFNGYMVKKEPRYYIKLLFDYSPAYLNVGKNNGKWMTSHKSQTKFFRTQFTQSQIDELQKDEQAKGLDLNALKVKVPDEELEDE